MSALSTTTPTRFRRSQLIRWHTFFETVFAYSFGVYIGCVFDLKKDRKFHVTVALGRLFLLVAMVWNLIFYFLVVVGGCIVRNMAGILAISYTSLLFYILLVLPAPDMRWGGGGQREKILVRSTLHDTETLQSWGKTARNFSSITYCQESNYAQIIYHLNSVDF